MTTSIIYINHDNKATLSCPKCSKAKIIDASKFIAKEGPLKLTYKFKCSSCDCGNKDCSGCNSNNCSFHNKNTVVLERRHHFRKEVNLPAVVTTTQKQKKINVFIQDISRTGLNFKMVLKTELSLNEILLIEFHLDNKPKTFIRKKVLVKKINKLIVGVEYSSSETYAGTDKAIGFYLT